MAERTHKRQQTRLRLRAHGRTIYGQEATSLRVREITARCHLVKAECLSAHLYHSRDSKVKPARVRYPESCPICAVLRRIGEGIGSVSPLK